MEETDLNNLQNGQESNNETEVIEEKELNNQKPLPKHVNQNIFNLVMSRKFPKRRRQSIQAIHNSINANVSLMRRLSLTKELKKHRGCVNTVNWSDCGSLLVSGSDDTECCVWNYYKGGTLDVSFPTGHTANIFCTKFMPLHNNTKIITCAGDNEVRGFDCGGDTVKRTHVWTQHQGRVKKLITFDGDPNTFLSASEDGTVRHFDIREKESSCGKKWVDLQDGLEINCIANYGDYFCIGCSDPLARVYDLRMIDKLSPSCTVPFGEYAPQHLLNGSRYQYTYRGHITGVAFHKNEILASYSGDDVYLFDINRSAKYTVEVRNGDSNEKMDKEDFEKSDSADETMVDAPPPVPPSPLPITSTSASEPYVQKYTGHCNIRTVKGVSFLGPNGEYVASGSDDGRIFIWEKYSSKLINLMKGDSDVVNVISWHPHVCAIATSGIDKSIKLWEPTKDEPVSLKELERRDSARNERAIPLSLLRALFRTHALEISGDELSDDDSDSGESGDDARPVECRMQ